MNVVFSEIIPNIMEELEGNDYIEHKVFADQININTDTTKSEECIRNVEKIKLELTSTDIKSPSNVDLYNTVVDHKIKIEHDTFDFIKVEFNNKQQFCGECNEYYEGYCTKCGMLVCILNDSSNKETRKEIPTDILEIKDGLFEDTGIFALKTIPKGVKFGPFTGFNVSESSWKLKGGNLVVHTDKLNFLNWMQYVNCASSVSDQNLCAFQHEDSLYYSSIREIREGEELLVYFGEECEESLNIRMLMDFIPHVDTEARDIFACTYCCLGFSLKIHLVEHKNICPKGTNGNLEELVQCASCKIYLENREYSEYHGIHCRKVNERHTAFSALDDGPSEEKRLSSVTNKHKRRLRKVYQYKTTCKGDLKNRPNGRSEMEMLSCGICYKKFKKKTNLRLHIEKIHVAVKRKGKQKFPVRSHPKCNIKNKDEKTASLLHRVGQFKCKTCTFQTRKKNYLKDHIKRMHSDESDYQCIVYELGTNYKFNSEAGVKTEHSEECEFKCLDCEFKTNDNPSLESHIKTIHRKQIKYKCMDCEFKTKYKCHIEKHIKTVHLKQKDFKCTECMYETNYKINLDNHVKVVHLKQKDYKCSDCEYKTNYKSKLKLHVEEKHLKKHYYKCESCEFGTNYLASLKKHVKEIHRKPNNYKCTDCEYKTNYKHNFKIHMKTKHLKQYNFKCTTCEYGTNYKINLDNHVKVVHLKQHDFKCTYCEYGTNYKYCLKTHIKTKHLKQNDFKCTECAYETNIKHHLERHIKAKHLKQNDCKSTVYEYERNYKYCLKKHETS